MPKYELAAGLIAALLATSSAFAQDTTAEPVAESAAAAEAAQNPEAAATETAAPSPEPAATESAAETPVVGTVPVAAAQSAAPPVAAAPTANTDQTQLDDVVVTAQRQVETTQKAAVSIDAIEGDAMARDGIVDTRRLSEKMPSLISNSTSGVATYVRGVGTQSIFSYTDPAVSFNYDGVYFGRSTSTFGLFYDLERVELLKGPQGTLYGRNATGGALNILPKKPDPAQREATGSLSYGNFSNFNFEGAYNQPLGEDSALRVSAMLTRADGYLDDGGDDRDMKAGRAQWFSRLGETLDARIGGDFCHVGGFGEGRTYYGYDNYDTASGTFRPQLGNFDRSQGLFSPAEQAFRTTIFDPLVGRTLLPYNVSPYMNSDFYGANGELNWTTSLGTVTVVPAWRAYKLDTLVGNGSPVILQEQGRQTSLEARLSAKDIGIFDYTVGTYFFHESMSSDGAVTQQAIYAHQTFDNKTGSSAVFGRLTAHVTDELRLVGGARYTKDKKQFDGTADGLVLVCIDDLAGVYRCPTAHLLELTRTAEEQPFTVPRQGGPPAPQPTDGTLLVRQTQRVVSGLSQGKLTYRGAVEYDLAKDKLLFGSYETGFRSGGFGIAQGYESYQPEEIAALTLGSKNRFFGVVEVNVEAFSWDYKDQQLGRVSTDAAGNQAYIISNVGTSKIRGFEIDTRALLTPLTRVNLALQMLDSKYSTFVYQAAVKDLVPFVTTDNAPPPYLGCPYTTNPTVNGSSTGYTVDCSGKPAFNAPKWTANLGLSQTVPVGPFNLVLNLDTQYRSNYAIGFEYLPFEYQGSSWRSSFTAALMPWSSADHWSLSAFVRNIENTKTLNFAASIRGTDVISYSEPRTFGMRATYGF